MNEFNLDLQKQFEDTGERHEGTPILAQTFPNNCRVEFVVDQYSILFGALASDEPTAILVYIHTLGKDCFRKGYARTTIENILRIVDKHNMQMELSVAPFGSMNESDLVRFYSSLGFEFADEYDNFDAPIMLRRNPERRRINPKKKRKVSAHLLTNPYSPLQNKKNALVPKEMVTLVGFDSDKTRQVEDEIPFVLGFIEEMRGESLVFPTPIRAMTVDEFNNGRNTVDSGHPMGAGHGQINLNTFDIAINPMMDVFDIVTNIFHENLHYAFPHWKEETVRDATGLAMENLYNTYNLGRPFAEERNE